jgi:hypothetical protein
MAELASVSGLSRQVINTFVKGVRGGGNFPKPVYGVSSGAPLYDWPEVAHWLVDHEIDPALYEVAQAAMESRIQPSRFSSSGSAKGSSPSSARSRSARSSSMLLISKRSSSISVSGADSSTRVSSNISSCARDGASV